MNILNLALKNIRGAGYRSLAIFLAVMGVAGFLLSITLVIAGVQYSLDAGLKRLGADLIVVPLGAETKVETALLMGKPTNVFMPKTNIDKIAALPGVAAVSPQVYLSSMYNSPCCSVSEMFVVVYDPATDFTIKPWLINHLGRELKKGEVIGGTYIFVPQGDKYIKIYGSELDLVGTMEPTGTGSDQTMFTTMETAQMLANNSANVAMERLYVNPDTISTIMVKTTPGVDPHLIAIQVAKTGTDMVPIESPNLFGMFRNQMNGLLWGFFSITLVVWGVAMYLIGIVFSMAANERRRELAVLRAVGATKHFVFSSLLLEAGILALGGAIIGIAFAGFGLYIFRDALAGSLKMPFLFPSVPAFIGLFSGGVALAIITVSLSAMLPAIRITRQELAIAMRE